MTIEFTYHSVWELGKDYVSNHNRPTIIPAGSRFSVIAPRHKDRVRVKFYRNSPIGEHALDLTPGQLSDSVNVVLPIRRVNFRIRELATGKLYSALRNEGEFVENPNTNEHRVDYDGLVNARSVIANMIRMGRINDDTPVVDIINPDHRRGDTLVYPVSPVWWDSMRRMKTVYDSANKVAKEHIGNVMIGLEMNDIVWKHLAIANVTKRNERPRTVRSELSKALIEYGLDVKHKSGVILLKDAYDAVMLRVLYPDAKVIDL